MVDPLAWHGFQSEGSSDVECAHLECGKMVHWDAKKDGAWGAWVA